MATPGCTSPASGADFSAHIQAAAPARRLLNHSTHIGKTLRARVRNSPLDVFKEMEEAFESDWMRKFAWENEVGAFATWPEQAGS